MVAQRTAAKDPSKHALRMLRPGCTGFFMGMTLRDSYRRAAGFALP